MARTKKATTPKPADQPMTAATIATEVTFTGGQRLNILHELTNLDMDFANAARYGKIWDAVVHDWDWSELYRDARKMADDERKAYNALLGTVGAADYKLKITRPVLDSLREFLQKKLDQEAAGAPKKDEKPELDTRWKGQIAITMRKLWDKINALLEGVET